MNRRSFLVNTGKLSSAMALSSLGAPVRAKNSEPTKCLNAYYFRAHMYTMVPRQVREDLSWMRDIGTDIVSVAILEQDLFAAVENIAIICNEATKLGMQVYAVPSRWGGLFAGAPKVPSLFSVQHPEGWILEKDGQPHHSTVSGVISSVHYPEVYEFCCQSLGKMFRLWDIKGVVWDEPKTYIYDHSPLALKNLGLDATFEAHIQATVDFHGRINRYIKEKHPGKVTCLFNYANIDEAIVRLSAKTPFLDYFGADGRPWYPADEEEKRGKTLLVNGERHLAAARANDKKTLWLIENHNLKTKHVPLMERRLPEVLEKGVDHLIYYYYPRNLEDPDRNMNVLASSLKSYKK